MNNMTLAELLSHPRDLYFGIVPLHDSHGYGLMVTRGPQHNYKQLFSWTAPGKQKSKQEVVQVLSEIFQGILKSAKDPDSLAQSLLSSGGEVLNKACMDKILTLLDEYGEVDTHVLWPEGTPLPVVLPEPINVQVKIDAFAVAALLKNPRDLRVEIVHVPQEGGYVLRIDRGPKGGGRPFFASGNAIPERETAVAVALGALLGLFRESNEPGTYVRGLTADADELLCGYCIEAICKELMHKDVVNTHELWPPGTSLPG
jgi:hypothetical protein